MRYDFRPLIQPDEHGMRRRDLLKTGMAGLLLQPLLWKMRAEAARAPSSFELVEISGDQALATWEKLRTAGRGAPVVLGDPEIATRFLNASDPGAYHNAVLETLGRASHLRFPKDFPMASVRNDLPPSTGATARLSQPIVTMIEADSAGYPKAPPPLSRQALEEAIAADEQKLREAEAARLLMAKKPEVGRWPGTPLSAPSLTVIDDASKKTPPAKVSIALIPTDDWTTIPAHLQWGGVDNFFPAPEWHVAALRSWRDRYGAELVGIGLYEMNVRAARRPITRHSALDLAREQFNYCPGLVLTSAKTLSARAAELMANDWWYFGWK